MPLSKRDAERCLLLLWDYMSLAEAPEERQAYEKAISSLHAYLTDILPASLPCFKDGVMEIFPDQDANTQRIVLSVFPEEKLGIGLDSVDVDGWSESAIAISPIVVSLLIPNSIAAKDGRLARGDQILSINDHSLSQVSLQRARSVHISCSLYIHGSRVGLRTIS